MKFKLTSLSDEHKDILRAQRQFVMDTLDVIATYLAENGDVDEEWRSRLNKEHMINYYDVIPDKGRLGNREIDLELLVINENVELETKVFKKDVRKAHEALICIANATLKERKERLLDMTKEVTGEYKELVNAHIRQTESLIDVCCHLKFSSQLLVAEIGGLHFAEQILSKVRAHISSVTQGNYIQFKNHIIELKRIIQLHTPTKKEWDSGLRYNSRDIFSQRQEFNTVFNLCKSIFSSFFQEGLLDPRHEGAIIADFNYLQHMFFAKCDVNLMAVESQ